MAVTDTPPQPSSHPTAPIPIVTTGHWWRRNLDPEERRRVMEELAMSRVPKWAYRFTVMLTLSVVVAVMGLSAGSAAVVIGAMLLAPLMTPVLATAACLSMSLIGRSLVSLLKVAMATAWCILIAYVLSRIIPDGPLSSEVEARTRPDIRDLVVALAAGAAGSYATVRKDASSALPGVAVAVALVPPLATVGITLEAGKPDLAAGALLLYVTNLAAIVFAGVMVFIATGFVPPRRLANTAVRLVVAFVIALVVVVAVAVPLYSRSAEVVEAVQEEVAARSIVDSWLGDAALSAEVDVTDDRVLVQLRGFDAPPDDATLTTALQQELGDVTVLVEWIRTERATTTTQAPLSEDEALMADVEPLVEQWLTAAGGGAEYELEGIRLRDGAVTIDVAGTGDPPSVDDLVALFQSELGRQLPVRVNWTPRETFTTTGTVPPTEQLSRDMEQRVIVWADDADVDLDRFSFDGALVVIEVTGAREPNINTIVVILQDLADDGELPVRVLFTRQELVTTTTIAPIDPFGGSLQLEGPSGPNQTTPGATTTTTVSG